LTAFEGYSSFHITAQSPVLSVNRPFCTPCKRHSLVAWPRMQKSKKMMLLALANSHFQHLISLISNNDKNYRPYSSIAPSLGHDRSIGSKKQNLRTNLL
jgi:hypothetical protein